MINGQLKREIDDSAFLWRPLDDDQARPTGALPRILQHRPSPGKPFTRIYIDALVGTGECDINLGDGLRSTIAGSAKIALDTAPAFDGLHRIDFNPKHVAELRGLVASPGGIDRVSEQIISHLSHPTRDENPSAAQSTYSHSGK